MDTLAILIFASLFLAFLVLPLLQRWHGAPQLARVAQPNTLGDN